MMNKCQATFRSDRHGKAHIDAALVITTGTGKYDPLHVHVLHRPSVRYSSEELVLKTTP